jgi:carbon storage regulator CsrA
MLVLQRRVGESVCVGRDVEVRVLAIRNRQVKIGVIAPRHVEVRRSELETINRSAVVADWRSSPLADLAKKLNSR